MIGNMNIQDFRNASDAILRLNEAALSLVRVNWDRCPWAEEKYNEVVRLLDGVKDTLTEKSNYQRYY